jgi:hypothetical protein
MLLPRREDRIVAQGVEHHLQRLGAPVPTDNYHAITGQPDSATSGDGRRDGSLNRLAIARLRGSGTPLSINPETIVACIEFLTCTVREQGAGRSRQAARRR